MRLRIPLLLTALALGTLAVTHTAGATHVRPKAAVKVQDSLVIAQKPCGTPDTTHVGPPGAQSCTSPQQVSQFVTAGTPDVNFAAPSLVGSLTLRVVPGDVRITSRVTDVRCLPSTSQCSSTANTYDGPDYLGQLQVRVGVRITDHYNAGGTTPATVTDIPFPRAPMTCTPTGPIIGATCNVNTTMNAILVVPGSAPPGKFTVYQIPQRTSGGGMQVWDGGASGVAGASDSTLFLEPGVYLP